MRESERARRLLKIARSIIYGGSAYCLLVLVAMEYTKWVSSIWVRGILLFIAAGLLVAFIGVLSLLTVERTSGRSDSK